MLSLLTDFPDRLSPMLVKELRQGLRAKTFVTVFISLQIAMAFTLLIAGLAAATDSAGGTISNIIFIFFSIAVLIVQPLRGVGAISAEIKGNTIDMMVLTRLSATRIVYGKWFAIISQSGLLLATIIPYLILRYFFGGMNLVGEIVMLMLIFLGSMVFTAITVGISATPNVIIRALLPIIGLPVLVFSGLASVFDSRYSTQHIIELCTFSDSESRLILGGWIAAALYLGWLLLSIGSSAIAASSENLTSSRRIVSLVLAIVAAVICVFVTKVEPDAIPFVFALIASPAIAIALSEPANFSDGIRDRFEKRGALGKLAGLFLSPGWPSGVAFTMLITIIAAIPHLIHATPDPSDELLRNTVSIALLGGLLFPAVIQLFIRGNDKSRFGLYLMIFASSIALDFMVLALSDATHAKNLLWFFGWSPTVMIPLTFDSTFRHAVSIAASCVTGTYLLVLILAALITVKKQRQARLNDDSTPSNIEP